MIPGGIWTTQNKKLPGAYINFITKQSNSSPTNPENPENPIVPTSYLLLTDRNGVLIKSADGFYLAVTTLYGG